MPDKKPDNKLDNDNVFLEDLDNFDTLNEDTPFEGDDGFNEYDATEEDLSGIVDNELDYESDYDDEYDDDYNKYDEEYDDDDEYEYDDEYDEDCEEYGEYEYEEDPEDVFDQALDLDEGAVDNQPVKEKKKGGPLKIILGSLLALALVGGGGYFAYDYLTGSPNTPTVVEEFNSDDQNAEQGSEVSESNAEGEMPDETATEQADSDTDVEFKYAISHAGDASDRLNQMNADFRTATSLYTQNNDLEGYKEALNTIESQRQSALAELSNHDPNDLSEIVEAQYQQFFNALNTAFGAKTTDQAVNVFNQWNEMQNNFNQKYTDKLTSMLDDAGIEWSQTETDAGLTIVY